MKSFKDYVLVAAVVSPLLLFIATGFGACGPEAQELVVGCTTDMRDWNHHYHIHQH